MLSRALLGLLSAFLRLVCALLRFLLHLLSFFYRAETLPVLRFVCLTQAQRYRNART